MKRIMLILTMVLVSVATASAQIPMPLPMSAPLRHVQVDTIPNDCCRPTHVWRTAAEIVGMNTGLWAFDKYVMNADYARINIKTLRDNFTKGWVWDTDYMGTNVFLHPYNGSLYFNAARSNGLNFWQSSIAAFGGSLMWEMIFECELPSKNDIIATPVGGTCLGEVLFRASDALIDDRTTGSERFLREAAVFLISPMRGINRIITGDAWRHRDVPGRCFRNPNTTLELSTGVSVLDFLHDQTPLRVGASMRVNFEYGDRFHVKTRKPYDYFSATATVGAMKEQPFLQHISITGRLIGHEMCDLDTRHMSVGLYQHFDYYDSDTINGGAVPYKLGAPASVGAGFNFRNISPDGIVVDANANINGVLLGAILSDHFQLDQRNYNLAMGFSAKGGVGISAKRFSLLLNNEYYRLYTWKGYKQSLDLRTANPHILDVMGDKSNAFFTVTTLRADYAFTQHISASLFLEYYLRHTNYAYYPDITSRTYSGQLMFTYRF